MSCRVVLRFVSSGLARLAVCSEVDAELGQLFERIEHLEPRPFKVSVIPGGDRESMAARRRCDVTVLDRHALTGGVEQSLLLGPDMGN